MEKSKDLKSPMVKDIFHIFSHYMEISIPKEEWAVMTVEQVLHLIKDIELLAEEKISPSEFSKNWKLPRT